MDTNDIDPTEHTPVASIFGQPTETFTEAERAMASTQAEDVVIEQDVNNGITHFDEQAQVEANLTASNEQLIEQAQPLDIPTEVLSTEALPEQAAVEAYEADTPVEAQPEAPPATNEFVESDAIPLPEAEVQETVTEALPEVEAVVTADLPLEAAEQAPELPAEVAEGLAIGEAVEEVVVTGVDTTDNGSVTVTGIVNTETGDVTITDIVTEAVAEPVPVVTTAPEEVVVKPKSKRGFASMTPERRREIAAKGGKSVPKTSRYFYQSHENASNAGKIGGKVKGPRKPKAKPEAVTVAAEPTPTVEEAVIQPTSVIEAPIEQVVVEAQPEVTPEIVPEPVQEVVPASPIETIVEGEPEIPAYLRKLAGGGDINI